MDTGDNTVLWHYYDFQVYQALLSVALIRSYWIFVQLSVVQLVQWQGEEGKCSKVHSDLVFSQKCDKVCMKYSRRQIPYSYDHSWRLLMSEMAFPLALLSRRASCEWSYEHFSPFHFVLNRCMTENPQDICTGHNIKEGPRKLSVPVLRTALEPWLWSVPSSADWNNVVRLKEKQRR